MVITVSNINLQVTNYLKWTVKGYITIATN